MTTIKHGHTSWRGPCTPEYRTWRHMKERCHNPKDKAFGRYGGRGIIVCAQWRNDFLAFFNYIGPRPSSAHSIDRYPNPNGNYEPGNVRWATQSEQVRNTNQNVNVTVNGETLCIADWAVRLGISPYTLYSRYKKNGSLQARDDAEWRSNAVEAARLARLAKQTCLRGHPFDRVRKDGVRLCSVCQREANKRYLSKKGITIGGTIG